MTAIIPLRRPFFGKLNTSILKRRYRFNRWVARARGLAGMPMTCRYLGAEFLISPGDLIGDEIAINRYEWRELQMMLAACRRHRPALFIDVGANIGLYSCIIGKAGVVHRIVAFEPDRRNFRGLLDNIRRNGLADIVEPRQLAVGAKAGTTSLVAGGSENTGLSRIEAAHPGAYPVDVVELDGMFGLAGSCVVLKIDAEGYEREILLGGANLFRANTGYAQVETHGDARAAEITEIMRGYGWQFVDRYGLDARFERTCVAAPKV